MKTLKHLLIGLGLILGAASAHATPAYVQMNPSSPQVGSFMVTGGTVTTKLSLPFLTPNTYVQTDAYGNLTTPPTVITNYIQNSNTLQAGSAFHVSSGTVEGPFTATGTVTLGAAGKTVTISSNAVIAGSTFYNAIPYTNACGYLIGSIVQSTQTIRTDTRTTASATYVTTQLYTQFTPKCGTDDVQIHVSCAISNQAGSSTLVTLEKGGVDRDATTYGFAWIGSAAAAESSDFGFDYLDKGVVNTTLTTYEVFMKVTGGTGTWNPQAMSCVLVANEVAR